MSDFELFLQTSPIKVEAGPQRVLHILKLEYYNQLGG